MAELRWILLLIGIAFLVVLTAWEMRRSRRARRELSEPPAPAPTHGEPELGHLPEEFAARTRTAGAAPGMGRVPNALPPIVELPPLDAPDMAASADAAVAAAEAEFDSANTDTIPNFATATATATAAAADTDAEAAAEAAAFQAPPPEPAELGAEEPEEPAVLTVEWPPEGERQIIALRIAATTQQWLSGRTARQALAASGFVHGRYGIFHQPTADGRALLSCANLSKPGIFDPASMDFQRFAGLSLFTVLPGPLPAEEALDRLLETGWELAQRLQGHLQDEQGRMLDQRRVEELRHSVRQHSAGTMGAQPAEPAA